MEKIGGANTNWTICDPHKNFTMKHALAKIINGEVVAL